MPSAPPPSLRTSLLPLLLLPVLAVPAPALAQAGGGQTGADLFRSMPARLIGPAGMSGRIASVDVDPTDRSRIIVGTAAGGVWRSLDGGVTWHPIFDDQDHLSIGDARISPANPDHIWVGTGEGNPRQSVGIGNGVYLSQDRGESWTHLGLEGSERIHRVIPHPTDPDVAYVASMGPLWNGGGERGVYRTRDRGRSWEQVLAGNEFSGAADLVMDPRNPDKLVAALYEHRRFPWNLESGGVGSGIHITWDGGESWTKLGPEHGVPAGPLGRIGVAIAASNPDILYALIEATPSVLIRSDDGGRSWRVISDEEGISHPPGHVTKRRHPGGMPKNEKQE